MMLYALGVTALIIYLLCSCWFMAGSLIQLHLLWLSRRRRQPNDINGHNPAEHHTDFVTIQIPVYNERHVIARLLTALSHFDYPKNRFEIQVLDDSTDDTSSIIDRKCEAMLQAGFQVSVIRRPERTGFKAGALQHGLSRCRGGLIAIFDADFIPPPDFIGRLVNHFNDPAVGGVQCRWDHFNFEENHLTRIQAFLLDSHFQCEQQGRSAGGYFVNFNGTAGMWRKECILDSGGWNGDVLTEDLELSYRSQLAGWKFLYVNDIAVPAELPADINAFKAQQFRWAKGMAQTAGRYLGKIISASLPPAVKFHAFYHLLGSISFLSVLGTILMTLPIIVVRHLEPEFKSLTVVLLFTGITLPALCLYYYFGTMQTISRKTFWKYLPLYLVVFMGLAVQNSVAVVEGLMQKQSPFLRTPKTSGMKDSGYLSWRWSAVNTLESAMLIYVAFTIILSIWWQDYFLMALLLMMFTGQMILLIPAVHRSRWRLSHFPLFTTLRVPVK